MDVKDFDGHATGAGFGVWLEENGLVGVAGDNGIGAGVCEEAF